MAGIYEADQVLKVADLGDTIFVAEAAKTPFTAMVKSGPSPENMLTQWPAQAYPRRAFAGTVDGYDKTAFDGINRGSLSGYGMWMMSAGWLVSKLADLTSTAGVRKGKEIARQQTLDALMLALQIERQMLSNDDCQAEAKPTKAYRSRGAMQWLATTAQGVLPVPADFLPASGTRYTGAIASYTSAMMEAQLRVAATAKQAPVDLVFLCGIALKAQMSTFTTKVTTESNITQLVQSTQDLASKKAMQVVDFFEFDSGKLKAIPTWNLCCDSATGADTAYTSRSGIGVDLAMWRKRWYQAPATYREPPKSGGPRGYADAVYILECGNPLGQISNYSST